MIDKDRCRLRPRIFLAEEGQAQGAKGRGSLLLARTNVSLADKFPVQRNRGCRQGHRAGRGSFEIRILIVALGRVEDTRGVGLRSAPLRSDCAGAGVNPVVIDVGIGRADRHCATA